MRSTLIRLSVLGFTMALVVGAALTLASCKAQAPSGGSDSGALPPAPAEVGDPLPQLALTDAASGATVNLPGDLEGRPFALLYFSYG